jgi:hypothetical protein
LRNKGLNERAQGQTYHIRIRARNTFHHECTDPLNSIASGFAKRFAGGDVCINLLPAQVPESHQGFHGFCMAILPKRVKDAETGNHSVFPAA